MELEAFNEKVAFKVFNKKHITTRLSPLFKSDFLIEFKDVYKSFIRVEVKNDVIINGVKQQGFSLRTRIYYPNKYCRMQEEFTRDLTLDEMIAYLKTLKLTIKL